jgi:hypothetical protein
MNEVQERNAEIELCINVKDLKADFELIPKNNKGFKSTRHLGQFRIESYM